MSNLEICLTPSQSEFVRLVESNEAANCLFVGGPNCGKSYTIGLMAVMLAQHSKEADIYVYAPEHHHIRTIEVPNVLYWLNQFKIKSSGYLSHEGVIKVDHPNCGNIYFKPLDNPDSFVGYQSYAALIDELDTFSMDKAEYAYKKISERNRKQPRDVPIEYKIKEKISGKMVCMNKMLSFTTPEGFNFCYKRWELNPHPNYRQVKGKTADNPNTTEQYLENIRDKYPPHVAEAYLNGEFINMDSLSVYFNYDPQLHDSFEEVQGTENLYVGCDFNVDNTAAVVFVKRNGKEWHAVDEYTGVRDSATLADMLHRDYASKGHKITIYPDSTGKARSNANASVSAISELQRKGFLIRANGHNFKIVDRTAAVNNAFTKAWLYVNQRNCPITSRCLINQPIDKNGKPCKKTGYDHSNDAFGYPIVFELGLRPQLFRPQFSFAQKR